MRGWWIAIVAALTGCRERAKEASTAPLDAYVQPTQLIPDPPPPPDAAVVALDAREPLTSAPTHCLEPGVEGEITLDPKHVTYCQHETFCAIWDRKTKRVRLEPRFDAEVDPDAEVGTQVTDKPDDKRIAFVDDRIELCPPSRACFQFRPEQSGGVEVQRVLLNTASTVAAVVLAGEGGAHGRVELWSTETGRRTVQVPVRNPEAESIEIRVEFVADGLIVYAIDEDEYASATLYGLDGRKRAALGDGSVDLDFDYVFPLDRRRLAVFDWGKLGAPYRVLVQDVRSGAVLERFKIPLTGEENVIVDRFDEAILTTEGWSTTEVRIDVIDARPKQGIHEFYVAPGC